MENSITELGNGYDLELDRVLNEIKKQKAGSVLLQFPDGLKPYACEIADYVEKESGIKVLIWLGSCFGACDVPESKVDLVVQFGHASWVSLK